MRPITRALRDAVLDEHALAALLLEHERIGPSVHSIEERSAEIRRIARRETVKPRTPAQLSNYAPRRSGGTR